MEIKSVLVALDASELAIAGARGAARIAAAHDAHLIGLHVVDISVPNSVRIDGVLDTPGIAVAVAVGPLSSPCRRSVPPPRIPSQASSTANASSAMVAAVRRCCKACHELTWCMLLFITFRELIGNDYSTLYFDKVFIDH